MDVPLRVTAPERTLVDLVLHPSRVGGMAEILFMLDCEPYRWKEFDCRKVADYAELLGLEFTAGIVGWWLETWQSELNVSERTLDRLEALRPDETMPLRFPHYHENPVPIRRWRISLPQFLLEELTP
ncbi:MAG: hypothetical protein F4Y68_02095 [Boseongicola sp. SB0665_bin_10]|nr:hypothetical protein [Boseongicola sp. SB0665_bin_10]